MICADMCCEIRLSEQGGKSKASGACRCAAAGGLHASSFTAMQSAKQQEADRGRDAPRAARQAEKNSAESKRGTAAVLNSKKRLQLCTAAFMSTRALLSAIMRIGYQHISPRYPGRARAHMRCNATRPALEVL